MLQVPDKQKKKKKQENGTIKVNTPEAQPKSEKRKLAKKTPKSAEREESCERKTPVRARLQQNQIGLNDSGFEMSIVFTIWLDL